MILEQYDAPPKKNLKDKTPNTFRSLHRSDYVGWIIAIWQLMSPKTERELK